MAKFKFSQTYGRPDLPSEIFIEAENEDEAWEKFDKKVIQPAVDTYTCEEEEG